MNVKKTWLALTGALVVGAVPMLVADRSPSPSPRAAAGAAPELPPMRAAPAEEGPAAPVAEARRYALRFERAVEMGRGGTHPAAVELTWIRARIAQRLGAVTWAIRATGAQVTPASATGMPSPAELETTFRVVTDPRGRPVELAFLPGTSEAAQAVLKILVLQGHPTAPPAGADRWTALESDGTGIFEARYERLGAGFERHKRAYVQVFGEGVTPAEVRVGGRMSGRFDAGGELEHLRSEDRLVSALGEGLPEVTARLSLSLRLLGSEVADVGALAARLDAARPAALVPEAAGAAAQRQLDEDLLLGAGYPEIVAELTEGLAASDRETRAHAASRAVRRLGAAVRLDAQVAEQIAARALDPATPVAEVDALAGGLASANTPGATQALQRLLESERVEVRDHAAVALALTDAVSPETVAALAEAAHDPDEGVRTSALLAMGAAGRHVGSPGAEVDPVGELLSRFEASRDPGERLLLLEALANSGDARLLELCTRILESADAYLWTAAVFGLRFVKAEGADALLVRLLAHPLAELRLAAVQAVGFRDLAAWRAPLLERLRVEEDQRVKEALQSLTGGA